MADDSIDDLLGETGEEKNGELTNSMTNAPSHVGTIFADGCLFATEIGENVRLQLVEYLPNASDAPDPGLKTRHVVNIVMPVEGFQATLQYLNGVNEKFFVRADDAE